MVEAVHVDPIAALILSLAIILVAAKVGAHFAVAFRQPPVLGELAAGVVLGNLTLTGFHGLDYLRSDVSVDTLSRLGVILLLFQVGLESTVAQMMKVGFSSFMVATLGVIGPFVLGWGVGAWLLPGAGIYAHIFIGATLTATSVGITARVLKDLGRSDTDEARIILGAAVIDDVQGLVILAVVGGIVAAANRGTALSYGAIGLVLAKATLFLVGALGLGVYLSKRLFTVASRLNAGGVLLALGLAFCFVLAWLVPVFFVIMGVRTDVRVFGNPAVLGLAAALTAAAIVGKQLCALGVARRGLDRLSVGIGMIPRGEVGLIFANMGLTLTVAGVPLINQDVFSAVVVMVMCTTLITPPALKWSFQRFSRRAALAGDGLPARANSAI